MGQILTFGPSSIRARRRKPRSMFYDQAVSSNPAEKRLKEALVWLQPSGIEATAGSVTAWRNSGTGGSQYDITTIAGNVTTDTLNGKTVVRTDGEIGTYLRTATGLTSQQPYTVWILAQYDQFIGGTLADYLYDGHVNQGASRSCIRKVSGRFAAYGGSDITILDPSDLDVHVFAVCFQNTTSLSVVDDLNPVSGGTTGANQFSALTLAQHNGGGSSNTKGLNGITGAFVMIPRSLSVDEMHTINLYLMKEFGI